jgi:hypothetical protein
MLASPISKASGEMGQHTQVKEKSEFITIELSKRHLHEEGRPVFLTPEENVVWEKFKGTVHKNVDLRFLLT